MRVELAFPPVGTDTLVGFKFGVIPVLGLASAVSLTVPEKPLMLATVMIAEPQVLGEISAQFELTEKSPVANACPIIEKLRNATTNIDAIRMFRTFFTSTRWFVDLT